MCNLCDAVDGYTDPAVDALFVNSWLHTAGDLH